MHGCPNRCRHCYLGCPPNGELGEVDLRWAAEQFRSYVRQGEDRPFFEQLKVSPWFREPDYSADYRHLHEIADELSDGGAERYELLSIWRLARDPGYADWARSVGPDTCQISFFGLEEATDWFCRRRGAFRDCIKATERLLDVGMKPRWQFFLTKKILPDLGGLMRLIDEMKLRQRVAELGGDFVAFVHPPDMSGHGQGVRHLAPTIDDVHLAPQDLLGVSLQHLGRDRVWETEGELIARLLADPEGLYHPYGPPRPSIWFLVAPNRDVYPNIGTYTPMWRLGNLRTDGVATIIARYENEASPALALNRQVSCAELAQRYGDPHSRVLDVSFPEIWFDRYCEEEGLQKLSQDLKHEADLLV